MKLPSIEERVAVVMDWDEFNTLEPLAFMELELLYHDIFYGAAVEVC